MKNGASTLTSRNFPHALRYRLKLAAALSHTTMQAILVRCVETALPELEARLRVPADMNCPKKKA